MVSVRTKHVSPIGNRVRDARERLGWTQTELSERADGVTRSYLSRLEAGQIVRPSASMLTAIAATRWPLVIIKTYHDQSRHCPALPAPGVFARTWAPVSARFRVRRAGVVNGVADVAGTVR